ncbi:16S rRNA (uracil(1498)-N(3))-methyltransferase [Gloeocapsopsis dulcis]|uniref:Ribosomal RNA small subunit methyltransferase E n=1 Tax=Gloeocapsopsis dulcis AAB1 = 1H9 TaxID=1433147 RepID=A0A6N8FZG8_9CHRO|nr:16S rRNA (uracil(1498)-N(3))-methyltransferase [Gloeocapsopsis dulcis]MUL37725.1 16S rRNA (uracil(1498)-N(3))-methyltransferase [Gloeocapsopsis dulcis AAB1 = 1H9]WNN88445.1 16S rRNA (uracil(1498)-N(3))-methyltransferase [Gloeocapsopsis dulcis]
MAQLQRLAIAPSQLHNEQIMLATEQQHYLGRVLRLREGDRFIAMDGTGNSWLAVFLGNQAQVLESIVVGSELKVPVTLILALPKGNGFDEVVRCCTEIGVSCIVPVLSDRTLLQPSPQKLERWRRIAKEAAEQSERSIIPTILEPIPLNQALATATAKHLYFCVARRHDPHLQTVLPLSTTAEIAIAIGPEGGWTTQEIESAIAAGFQLVSLGNRVLRAVTAPIVAMSLVSAAFDG